ncbi:hypothetical protein [Luteimonas terrae]|uniref:Glycosyltransferase family 2 protein n=1 Tax=Luteimonas terrae TaxID=1530191 RepID=A0A4R5U700_9GAMM|nr:hypothetical protein [Luteimonas terrae]TDK30051.1 hypothetical protein E2F49_12710 [Luteimonas terrae]
MTTGFRKASLGGLVLHYLDATRTATCVRSMLREGFAPILVWDNSGDGGRSVGELKDIIFPGDGVIYEGINLNIGFAAGVNRGLDVLSETHPGRPVLLLNNDAVLIEGAGHSFRAAASKYPEAAVFYPKIDNIGRVAGTTYYQVLLGLLTRRRLPWSVAHASGCCMLIQAWNVEGAVFDEDFFMYGEDVELGHRLQSQDRPMVHIPLVLVVHEGSASSGMASEFYESRMIAAHLILARKLTGREVVYWALLVSRCASLSIRAILRALRYRSTVPISALIGGVRIMLGRA